MKTKFAYTLICSDKNLYFEQARISAYSLKYYNPSAHIIVVLDNDTMSYIQACGTDFERYVDEFIVADVPSDYNGMQKSRYLKTRLRDIVDGDYLYLDTDTVIAGDLSEIDNCEYELAAVFDSNRPFPLGSSDYVSDWYINSHVDELGWSSLVGSPNYNGGVLLARDTQVTYDFYHRWYELWLECVSKKVNIDMIALCRANKELNNCIKELPCKWNCQIQRNGLEYVNEALIIHCFTGGNLSQYSLCEERLLVRLHREKRVDSEIIDLVNNARTAFCLSTTIVPTSEAVLLDTSIAKLFKINYFYFRVLNKIAGWVLSVTSWARYIKKLFKISSDALI